MDDMTLFDRFHAAFDIAPPAGGFERLRRELSNHRPDRRGRPAFQMRFTRMGFRVVAAAAVAVIAIALVAAYLAGQRPTNGLAPAGSADSVAAYQSMVQANYDPWVQQPFNCHAVTDPSCSTDLAANVVIVAKWRADLASFRTPGQFAIIDAQLQKHLADVAQGFGVIGTAIGTRNQALLDKAMRYAPIEVTWLDHAVQGITQSQPATASEYSALIQAENANFMGSCSSFCQQDASLGDCLAIDDALCLHDITSASGFLGTLQADVVKTMAPSQLKDQSTTLQLDLAQADDALVAMNDALLHDDAASLKAARASYLDALVAVESDLQS